MNARTKGLALLATLDIARQIATAVRVRQERQRPASQRLMRSTVKGAHTVADRTSHAVDRLRGRDTRSRLRRATPGLGAGVVVALGAAAVIAARYAIRNDLVKRPREAALDAAATADVGGSSTVRGLASAGAAAAGTTLRAVTTGTSTGAAAGKEAAMAAAAEQIDAKVVRPAKKKAIKIGVISASALTLWGVLVVVVGALLALAIL